MPEYSARTDFIAFFQNTVIAYRQVITGVFGFAITFPAFITEKKKKRSVLLSYNTLMEIGARGLISLKKN